MHFCARWPFSNSRTLEHEQQPQRDMLTACLKPRRKGAFGVPLVLWLPIAALVVVYWRRPALVPAAPTAPVHALGEGTPLVDEHIRKGKGFGGRWYIPESWIEHGAPDWVKAVGGESKIAHPGSAVLAAQLALDFALRNKQFIKHTNIPLIIHQTYKNFDPDSWSDLVRNSVEEWIATAVDSGESGYPKLAYILWDDEGMDDFIKTYEPALWENFKHLPKIVEKSDAFRVVVLRWFGGIYADVDTRPLKHPYYWVHDEDLTTWTDRASSHKFGLFDPKNQSYLPPKSATPGYTAMLEQGRPNTTSINAIYGLEADTPRDSDDYWRMGYIYPVQLTNWAFAMAPQHPATARYIKGLIKQIDQNATRLEECDPLLLTGPGPLVVAVRGHCESESEQFDWNGLSGLEDAKGGRGKIAGGDVLVLPITAFSPGRGFFHNMGSLPIDAPSARLFHAAQGSWRHETLHVEVGKLCRTFLGRCRDWSKVS